MGYQEQQYSAINANEFHDVEKASSVYEERNDSTKKTAIIIAIVVVVVLLLAVAIAVPVVLCIACKKDDDNAMTTTTTGTMPVGDNIVQLALSQPDLSTLVTALQAANLVDALSGPGPFTVFAPTNAAFEALPAGYLQALLADAELLKEVLYYHVVAGTAAKSTDLSNNQKIETLEGQDVTITISGGTVKVDDATVATADVEASNGVVHVLDQVLLFPGATAAIASAASNGSENIVQLAQLDSGFSTLVAALTAADTNTSANLIPTLSGAGTFTVFAPTDAAFAALPAGVLDLLLQPANRQLLIDILTYHVADTEVKASAIMNDQQIATLEGSTVTATKDMSDYCVKINGNKVVQADIDASNGVIHAIEGVLLPPGALAAIAALQDPSLTVVGIAQADPTLSTVVDLVVAADLATTLSGTGPFTVFAPSNAAFAALPAKWVTGLTDGSAASKALLQKILTYHAVNGDIKSDQLSNGQVVTTLQTDTFTVKINAGAISLEYGGTGSSAGTADVTIANAAGSNGVVHIIDAVMLYPGGKQELDNAYP